MSLKTTLTKLSDIYSAEKILIIAPSINDAQEIFKLETLYKNQLQLYFYSTSSKILLESFIKQNVIFKD